ncbi:xanthine dehydrogenase family protein subunit M [Klenkia sp. PcliD-1-E]|uniref:FAD binding domain-containing protein n=1 Tax=Klenkia sp. PcliD-1-E TaxID=2954492 RepID=UPI002096B1A6|nr:xanthine dehydrogenase family protein subunit M [Klenkia sp. PcliD-1-E]MCO7220573.1 xanthine dehydrogenase family protein subunit M [Klenkia sp. PcliD-1-E]
MLIPRGCTLERPVDLDGAVALLAADEDARPVGGGVSLTLLLRNGFAAPGLLVDLGRLRGDLRGIRRDGDGTLHIGALTTLREVETSPLVAEHSPVLAAACTWLASTRIRNTATLGGHLGHADPHQDLPPVLLALGAQVEVAGPAGLRTLPLDDLLVGYYETSLEQGELITAVRVPAAATPVRGKYVKTTARTVEDWPAVGVAVRAAVVEGRVAEADVAVGSVTVRAHLRPAVRDLLVGQVPTDELVSEAARTAAEGLEYASDSFGSASYKQTVVRVTARRALQEVLAP